MKYRRLILVCAVIIIFVISFFVRYINIANSINPNDISKITIAVEVKDSINFDVFSKLVPLVEIADDNEINNLIQTVNPISWRKPVFGFEYKGMPYYFILFDNGTVISMYSDEPYGYIMNYNYDEVTDTYTYTQTKGPYFFPQELLTKVLELVNQ